MLKRIFASEWIVASHFLIPANICFKIFVLKRIFAKLHANFTFKQIFACKYSHTSKYLLANITILANIRYVMLQNYIGKPFTRLRPKLIFGSFLKYSLGEEYSLPFLFFSHVKSAYSLRIKKRIKRVLFASKRVNIRFIFAYIRFEPNIPAHPAVQSPNF